MGDEKAYEMGQSYQSIIQNVASIADYRSLLVQSLFVNDFERGPQNVLSLKQTTERGFFHEIRLNDVTCLHVQNLN